MTRPYERQLLDLEPHIPFVAPDEPYLPAHANLAESANVICVDTLRELSRLMKAARLVYDVNFSDDYIKRTREHEKSHLEAAWAIGAVDRFFCVSVAKARVGKNDRYYGQAHFGFRGLVWMSNLMMAAICAYPQDLSEPDEDSMRDYGYEDADHVGFAAERHNRRRGSFKHKVYIPLPKSYKPDTRVYFLPSRAA